nr:hypothetical protein [uncultured Blautia sp.]
MPRKIRYQKDLKRNRIGKKYVKDVNGMDIKTPPSEMAGGIFISIFKKERGENL